MAAADGFADNGASGHSLYALQVAALRRLMRIDTMTSSCGVLRARPLLLGLGLLVTWSAVRIDPRAGQAAVAGGQRQAAAATVVPAQGTSAPRLSGTWRTIAAGDDGRAMIVVGDDLWLATAGGGVVHRRGDGSWRQYLAPQDGLPDNDVRAVTVWRDQTWFGTARGLARYEPAADRMTVVDVGAPTPAITALRVDSADHLWLAATQRWDPGAAGPEPGMRGAWQGGGLARTADGKRWQWLRMADGLPSLAVRDLAVWQGNLWLAAEPYWRWREAQPSQGQAGRWELAGGGVAVQQAGGWQSFDPSKVAVLSDRVLHLAPGRAALWMGTAGRGLVAYDGQRWQGFTDCGQPLRCPLEDYVTALAVGPDGAVWAGTARFNGHGAGLQVLDDGGTPTEPEDDGWFAFTGANGLPASRVNAIAPTADGSIWLALADWDGRGMSHGRGLAQLLADRTSFVPWRMADVAPGNLADNVVTCLARNPATGELWVGTAFRGISVREAGGTWRHYDRASTAGGLGSDDIADIVIEPSGVVWVATRQQTYEPKEGRWVDGGLSRFDGRAWQHLPAAVTGLPSDQLASLALNGRGKLWIGTGATDFGHKEHSYRGWGLAVLDTASQRWERTYSYPTLAGDNVTDLALGRQLWLSAAYFVPPHEPASGQLRLGGGASAYDFPSGQWRTYGEAEGLTPAVATRTGEAAILDYRAVAVDRSGAAWLGGLVYAGSPGADQVADGVIDVLGAVGTAHYRFAGSGAVMALAVDGEDRVWAATRHGGVRIFVDADWLHPATADGLPVEELTSLLVFGDEAWLGGARGGLAWLSELRWSRDPTPPTATAEPSPTEPRTRPAERIYLPIGHR